MTQYQISTDENTRSFDDEEAFEDMKSLLDEQGVEYEASGAESNGSSDGQPNTPPSDESPQEANAGLREDPIAYLKAINPSFVNSIKGTEAISKRGFRYIQSELGISTSSEVVAWVEDPYGVVIKARAELPDGRFAEAHGEGYPGESGIDKSEFVRYGDTRAKSRALSDLTSAGALATDELQGGIDG